MQGFNNLIRLLQAKKHFLILLLLVLTIPITLYVSSQQQSLRQHAASSVSCPKAKGPFIQQGIKILQEDGSQFIPYGTTTSGLSGAQYQSNIATDDAKIQATATVWCSNVIRLQFGQDNLVGSTGTTFSQDFMNAIKSEVQLAENLGLVVVINDQTESTGFELGPTEASRSFWKIMTQTYGNDPQVIFDLFNEPRNATPIDSQTWQLWQKGGVYNSITYLGEQDLVNEVRTDGAKNLLWIEGPHTSATLSEASSYPITGSPLMYAIHHPQGTHTPQTWETDFGYLITQKIAPVVEGEWSNYASTNQECWSDAPTAVPAFLSYLQSKQIGMTVWTLRNGVMLESNNFNDPSQIKSDWSCTNGLNEGAGTLVLNWYKNMQTPIPTSSTAPTPIPTNPTANCQPDTNMVNPCRPWVGASAFGNPGIPGKPVSQDVVSQFNYLEQLIGHPLDIFRDYHCAYGSGQCKSGDVPLNTIDIKYANRSNTYININWIPSPDWTIYPVGPTSTGTGLTVYNQIVQAAKSIKSIAPHPVFLSLWHEGNLHANDGDPTCPKGNGTIRLGTAAQSVTAWQNVHDIFKQQGVSNVIWVMNYASDPAPDRRCLVTRMWPGDQYVDWVTWDTYSRGKTWQDSSGNFYNFLLNNSNSSTHSVTNANSQPVDFTQKPWGIGEFGTCKQPNTGTSSVAYYQSVKAALDANTFPRIKMYVIYANISGNSGYDCLTDYDANPTLTGTPIYDQAKQAAVNALFNDPIFSNGTVTPTIKPSISNSPPSSPSPSSNGGQVTFAITVCPHGLGNCGDNSNPSSGGGNTSPKHTTRNVTLTFMKDPNSPVASIQGTVSYNPSSQNFQGKIVTNEALSGQYIVVVKMDDYLGKRFPGIFTINQGKTLTLPEVQLVAGDVITDATSYNELNIQDYNAITSCLNQNTSSSCPAPITAQSPNADLNDDGVIDITDANLFFREIAVQQGAGGDGGQPTPIPTMTTTPTPVKKIQHWIIGQNAATQLLNTAIGSSFIMAINNSNTYEINSSQSGILVDPLPNATHVKSFTSYQDMQKAITNKTIPPKVKVLLYDNESWPNTPTIEQQQPFTYVPLAEKLAHQNGYLFMNTPACDLAHELDPSAPDEFTAYLQMKFATLAQYADIFEIQAQRNTSASKYISFAQQAMAQARTANPQIPVLLGITTSVTTSQEIIDEIKGTEGITDGYWFNIIGTNGVTTALPVIKSL